MDIENAEWEVFLNTSLEILTKFSQIIVEFHKLNDFSDRTMEIHLNALRKINESHQSIHYAINNYAPLVILPSCSIGQSVEVTFVRRAGRTFYPDYSEYPASHLDFPNNPKWPAFFIGNLEIIAGLNDHE
jgi:hypothetical protein